MLLADCFFRLRLFSAGFFNNSFLSLYFGSKNSIRKTITFRAINIQVLDYNTQFQIRFSLHINCLLYHLFETNSFLVLLFYFNFDKRFKAFSKIANYNRFIEDFNKTEFCQDKLKVLKVRCPISDFLQLVLKIFSKLTPNIVNKDLEIFKVFSKKNFKLKLYNQNGVFIETLILSTFEIDNVIEK